MSRQEWSVVGTLVSHQSKQARPANYLGLLLLNIKRKLKNAKKLAWQKVSKVSTCIRIIKICIQDTKQTYFLSDAESLKLILVLERHLERARKNR